MSHHYHKIDMADYEIKGCVTGRVDSTHWSTPQCSQCHLDSKIPTSTAFQNMTANAGGESV
jgi:hypothetical protein